MSIIQAARSLLDGHEQGANPEYERALIELTSLVLGVGEDDGYEHVRALILNQD
jgi:hypothetical protein